MRVRFSFVMRALTAIAMLSSLELGAGEQLAFESHDGDGDALAVSQPGSQAPTPTPEPGHRPDSPHVCHCAHAHVLASVAMTNRADLPTVHREVGRLVVLAPHSFVTPPKTRPPIA